MFVRGLDLFHMIQVLNYKQDRFLASIEGGNEEIMKETQTTLYDML